MANSFTFNDVDLSAYGLTVQTFGPSLDTVFDADTVQLPDLALAGQSYKLPKPISLDVTIQADTKAELFSCINRIKLIVAKREAKQLVLDTQLDRYWLARFTGFSGRLISPYAYKGAISFVADDPAAYGVDPEEDTGALPINPDPDTKDIAVGGTGYVLPVWTLTATGGVVGPATIKLENITTVEELQWTGTVANGKVLLINSVTWHVTNDGVAAMSGLVTTSKFPRLKPGLSNSIKVTNFGNTGHLRIVYRNRYL